jgi:hypothetical protein
MVKFWRDKQTTEISTDIATEVRTESLTKVTLIIGSVNTHRCTLKHIKTDCHDAWEGNVA